METNCCRLCHQEGLVLKPHSITYSVLINKVFETENIHQALELCENEELPSGYVENSYTYASIKGPDNKERVFEREGPLTLKKYIGLLQRRFLEEGDIDIVFSVDESGSKYKDVEFGPCPLYVDKSDYESGKDCEYIDEDQYEDLSDVEKQKYKKLICIN